MDFDYFYHFVFDDEVGLQEPNCDQGEQNVYENESSDEHEDHQRHPHDWIHGRLVVYHYF